jgi:hypothetical protein
MSTDLFYANKMFSLAVRSLALGESGLRHRLLNAYCSNAIHAYPPRGGSGPAISAELQAGIEDLHARMTITGAAHHAGTIEESINAMSEDEVRGAAEDLVNIADKLDAERDAL